MKKKLVVMNAGKHDRLQETLAMLKLLAQSTTPSSGREWLMKLGEALKCDYRRFL